LTTDTVNIFELLKPQLKDITSQQWRTTQHWFLHKHGSIFTWRFKWAHQLTLLVTWHDYCWITNCSSDRMSSREVEHSMLVVAWFVSELPGKSVFAKQPP